MNKVVQKVGAVMLALAVVATSVMIAPQLSQKAYAESFVEATIGDWDVTIYDGGASIWFTGYNGNETTVTVPTSVTYNGTEYDAGDNSEFCLAEAFQNNTNVKEIIIPDGIVAIVQNSFDGCTSLEKVAIGATDTLYISTDVFKGLASLKDYYFAGDSDLNATGIAESGIGQDSDGNVYAGVTIHTIEGSPIDSAILSINAGSSGNVMTLDYNTEYPYEDAEAVLEDGSEDGASASGVGDDGTAIGEGATSDAAESYLTSYKKETDPEGSVYALLQAKITKVSKKSLKLQYKKVSGAKTYVVYGNACSKKNKLIKLTTTKKNSVVIKKIKNKKVKKGTYYKFIVVALDKNNNVVSTSKMVHAATLGGKVGNAKKLQINKNKVTLKKGKTFKLVTKEVSALKIKKHRKVAYESTNTKVATVSKSGKIKAKKKGKCYVYAYAQNGLSKKVKVIVK
ncbi:Ig-like domain-containing protein [Eubacterium oxidoreducens]|uniref:Leucine rich repeat-containing protein n=1 Tax=Eubacterium oxidoreducens TaxID=1732 RepID=A0A1G6BSJ4_EUBOX|nr:Ig-like domain-containing protein [Eubacterium oxidoreducens]SDB23603.1 Leucine rich repeat-containing protein [Eubacterium oxidoreducens]